MNVNDYYKTESSWLKAEDLRGRKVSVTIASIEEVTFNEGNKLALKFEGKERGLVMNKTNAQTIAEQLGHDTDKWIGKEIKIYPTTTSFQGEQVPCIRVEHIVPEADPEDAIPF